MEEVGVDMTDHYPKLLDEIPEEVDILITMGCNVVCPYIIMVIVKIGDWRTHLVVN